MTKISIPSVGVKASATVMTTTTIGAGKTITSTMTSKMTASLR